MLKRLKAKAWARAKRPNRSSDPVRVVVGLRNPGADHEGTRHNVGYEVVSHLIDRWDETATRAPPSIRGMIAQKGVGDDRALLFIPNTFMNESGGAVRALLDYHRVAPEDLLVIHDDIDLAFGRLRVQVDGGSGGHNGVRSVGRALGSNDFSRLKVGVGRPPGSQDPADFVLRRFTKKERSEVDLVVRDAGDVVELWLDDRVRAQEMAAHRGRDA